MMNVGIKNAILLLLIILILHFLLMNVIAERAGGHVVFTKDKTESREKDAAKSETFATLIDEDKKTACVEKKDDLLAYVMQDEARMDAPFVDSNDARFETEMPVVCDTKRLLNKGAEKEPDFTQPKQKKVHMKDQIHNNFLVIQEYENESALNGGKVFDGLCGFDEYGDTFQSV